MHGAKVKKVSISIHTGSQYVHALRLKL